MLRAGLMVGLVSVAVACSSSTPSPDASGQDVPPVDLGTDATVDVATTMDIHVPMDTPVVTDLPVVTDTPLAADAGTMDVPRVLPVITVASRDTRFVTREHMMASLEMQQAGEPLAQAMGRTLGGYDRYSSTPNLYADPGAPDGSVPVVDLVGFATAIESYEYSKQPMNNLAFESGAGLSLAFGPLDNPLATTGLPAQALLRDRVQHYALGSHAGVTGMPGFVSVPAPADNPLNPLGWSGFWPVFHPYQSFDPTVRPASGSTRGCSLTTGYGASAGVAQVVGDYECGYTTLHLLSREDPMTLTKVITPGVSGWSDWKWGLWVINYLQTMHDLQGNPIDAVTEAQLPQVGSPGNTLVGRRQDTMLPSTAPAGTFLGSSDIEGFQAQFLIDAMDNQAWHWLSALTTTDGSTLSGFATVTDALAYDYSSPLRWLPGAIAVTENARDASGFPAPTRLAITSTDSALIDLLGLLGGYAEVYAVTDRTNHDVGGAQAARAYFDGDPFAQDNGLPDGQSTLHDRALGLLKFVFVNLDRVHRDPATGILVDQVHMPASTPSRTTTVSTVSVDQVIVALRTLRRSLGGALTLYANNTPDTAIMHTPLDDTSLRGSPDGSNLTGRINALLATHAGLLYSHLTTVDGVVYPGWDVSLNAPTAMDGDLDAYAAALRGLLESYLATGESRYRDRAERVYAHMEALFYAPDARAWRSTAGPTGRFVFNPRRVGLMDAAFREFYTLDASRPGNEALATSVQNHLARLIKLVLNGWDDRNGDGIVQWPAECISVSDGLPRGGLQMAERALTGETGLDTLGVPVSDRDHDCVPEISAALLPSALANELVLTVAAP